MTIKTMPILWKFSTLLSMMLLLAACNISTPPALSPTPEILISDTPTLAISPSPTASLTPSATPTAPDIVEVPVLIASPIPSQENLVPTVLVTPTETPGPWTYVVKEGETLGYILQLQPWGYPPFDEAVINALLQANGLSSPSQIRSGQEILIPRRTPTPLPEGMELTQAACTDRGVSCVGDQVFVQGQEFGCHTVTEGDSLVGIMEEYDTTLEVLSQQNQNLNWLGCDFTNPSGGPRCNPIISLNQCINVPLPTGTPVPTATPSGSETPTATPTYAPARAFYPPQGGIATGIVELRWVSVGILRENETYLIELVDRTSGQSLAYTTNATSFTLPSSLVPSDGQTHSIDWRVSIGRTNPDGTIEPIGGLGRFSMFQWRSR